MPTFPIYPPSSSSLAIAKKSPNNRNAEKWHESQTGDKRPRTGLLGGGSPKKKKQRTVYGPDDDGDEDHTTLNQSGGSKDLGEAGSSSPRRENKTKKRTKSRSGQPAEDLLQGRMQLPIWPGRDGILEAIRSNDSVVILGETGSGKSTQVPQFLLESGIAGTGMIAVTQPRRVAAISLAARVAKERNTTLGEGVGYAVRFDDKTSAETRIKYLTDGMIVRELLSDPLLSRYGVVIVDEAHERTLRTDVLLANLKTIQATRNVKGGTKYRPLKVVIMSASLEAERFSQYFNNAKILYVKGRQHPVKIFYTAEDQVDIVDSSLRTFFQIHVDKAPGDVLIFLPGQEDIESLEVAVKAQSKLLSPSATQVHVVTMYAALSAQQQAFVFKAAPRNHRKCIIATNIAETSITVPGVRYVIDSGRCKEKIYHAGDKGHAAVETLTVRGISKSSALQRAGRAGREGPGWCFRLYTEATFLKLQEAATPEILRCDLTSTVLQLKCLNQSMENIDFMDPPNPEAIKASLISLCAISALDDKELRVTPLGKEMASLPVDTGLARALIASKINSCTREVLDILSLLSASSGVFLDSSADQREEAYEARKKFFHRTGDHMTLLNVIRTYDDIVQAESKDGVREWSRRHFLNLRSLREATEIRTQLRQACARIGMDCEASSGDNPDPPLKSLWTGFFINAAILTKEGLAYKQLTSPTLVKIHPASSMCNRKVPMIMYHEVVSTTSMYCRTVSDIPQAWITEIPFYSRRST